jgi:dipeptidyl aminopeptidase/acylaminoacyl peptidase
MPCPEAQVISTPFDLKYSLPSLVWSPDGAVAAFPYPIREDGNRAALFVFDPQAQTWESLAEFNFIDPPFWSPDGRWLAFRTQEGNGAEDIYAVRRDGTQLTTLSALEGLPHEDRPYMLNGWINNHVILRGSRTETVYLVRVDDGAVRPVFDIPWAKSDFFPSPDGYFLAYAEASAQSTSVKLLTPNGDTTRELAAFQDAWIFPITWSTDGTSLAFVARAADPATGQDIYVIGQDGRNLRQVYHSNLGSVNQLIFSPDGRYLMFQDDDAAGRHIFTIDLSTLEQRMLRIPNVPLDWWWLAPSWR